MSEYTYQKKVYEPVVMGSSAAAQTQQQKSDAAAQSNAAQAAAAKQTVNQPEPVDRTQYQYDASSNDAYQQALSALLAAQKQTPTYAGTYDARLDQLYDEIVNRKPFQYDINNDMLYQQYRDQYQNLGQLAMRDASGQAAALTGGYGNTFAQSVGQQQYDAYLQKLNEVVPQLYGMAQDQYNREGEALQQQFAMAGDLSDREYSRYQDALNNYWQNISYLQGEADNAYNRGYENWYNAQQMGMQQDQFNYQKEYDVWNQNFQQDQQTYLQEQDAYEKQLDSYNRLVELITSTGYTPSAEELAEAGMTEEQANAYKSYYNQQNGGSAGSSSSGSSSGSSSSKQTTSAKTSTSTTSTGATTSGSTSNAPDAFNGVSKNQAISYLEKYGAPTDDIMDQQMWEQQKIQYQQSGEGAFEVKNYSTYHEYLNAVVNRNMSYR